MNYQNYQNLILLTSSDTKRKLIHLFLFTNSAQRELVSICTQSIRDSNELSLHYNLGTKELYTGTTNPDIRKLCTVLCGRNVNKPSAPTEVEGKGHTALMWYYSPTKNKLIYQVRANTYDFWLSGQYGKYNSNIFLFFFSLKNDALPLNSLFWSPPTAVHRFDAWDMVVPGLYIPWT